VAMSDLTGRSAVVTGGGSGIGAALTRRLPLVRTSRWPTSMPTPPSTW
jgi:hypothetical protein